MAWRTNLETWKSIAAQAGKVLPAEYSYNEISQNEHTILHSDTSDVERSVHAAALQSRDAPHRTDAPSPLGGCHTEQIVCAEPPNDKYSIYSTILPFVLEYICTYSTVCTATRDV